ncbi:alpha/beta-hydrolase [Dendrothele bispora CBS 962.96]|uniref:Alpha/beta-hydrolase n=1 Tax=Dendrothele bispora (strain CBS 962.96) TaxID=1314807 RepID=A0A4S8MQY4_DENBC|nr:alpha/beta-hydrolase [Dendrothele bispora CBS 962.96]
MSLCQDCVKGVRHEGTPSGQFKKIKDVNCYVASPEGDYAKDKVLLFLPDAFGMQFVNNQLLVDDFAINGFKTVMIDYFNGDPVPVEAIDDPNSGFDWMVWLGKHNQEVTRPLINNVVAALKEEGITQFAATGYCFGGRYCFDLAFDNITTVTIVSHPSLLKVPDDLEKYASTAKAPLLINSCTVDQTFPMEAQAAADKIFGGDKFSAGYKREHFEGCSHGFAVRGDMSDPQVKAGKEGAFKAAVEWLRKYEFTSSA